MKILALNGSPTMKKGMTHILMTEFLDGVSQAGAEVEYIQLRHKKIGYCIGCYDCWLKTPGVCAQKDDMADLGPKFINADYVIIGTPLYVDGMTALTKTFIDRLVYMGDPHMTMVDGHLRHVNNHDKGPELVLVSVCGFPELDNFNALVTHMEQMCRNLHTRFVGAVLRPQSYMLRMDQLLPDEVAQVKTAAREAGRQLVEKGEFDPQTLAAVGKDDFISKEDFMNGANNFFDKCIEAGKFLSMEDLLQAEES